MLQPFTDRFSTADEGLSDWNRLDYNSLWDQSAQSPFSHTPDQADLQHSSVATNWNRMPSADYQHGVAADNNEHDQQNIGRFSEQVVYRYLVVIYL